MLLKHAASHAKEWPHHQCPPLLADAHMPSATKVDMPALGHHLVKASFHHLGLGFWFSTTCKTNGLEHCVRVLAHPA